MFHGQGPDLKSEIGIEEQITAAARDRQKDQLVTTKLWGENIVLIIENQTQSLHQSRGRLRGGQELTEHQGCDEVSAILIAPLLLLRTQRLSTAWFWALIWAARSVSVRPSAPGIWAAIWFSHSISCSSCLSIGNTPKPRANTLAVLPLPAW